MAEEIVSIYQSSLDAEKEAPLKRASLVKKVFQSAHMVPQFLSRVRRVREATLCRGRKSANVTRTFGTACSFWTLEGAETNFVSVPPHRKRPRLSGDIAPQHQVCAGLAGSAHNAQNTRVGAHSISIRLCFRASGQSARICRDSSKNFCSYPCGKHTCRR